MKAAVDLAQARDHWSPHPWITLVLIPPSGANLAHLHHSAVLVR
jgi:hypothetical protein